MNGRIDKPNTPSPWELDNVPQAIPPTVKTITVEIARRRRRHQRQATTATLAAVLISVVGMLWFRTNEDRPSLNDFAGGGPTTRGSGWDRPLDTPTIDAPAPTAGFNLYADIRRHAPVFRYDNERGAMVPVGWVESTDTVPVDLNGFSQDEIESFRTWLVEEPLGEEPRFREPPKPFF